MAVRYDPEGNRLGPAFQISLGVLSPYAGPCLPHLDDNGRMAFLYPQIWIGEGEPYVPSEFLTNIFLRIVEPDACAFTRGDVNGDGTVGIADVLVTLGHLFSGGTVVCPDAADTDDDETLDLGDATRLLGFLFTGRPRALPHPWPYPGYDPTP